ncbi:MAG TPA: FMN-binding protein [Patescibacteria group bacterium]|nr:FMN-binding protein [Patescibacteria group bacterium]
MKKILLSVSVIVVFALYSLHQQIEGSQQVIKGSNFSSSTSSQPTPTTGSGSSSTPPTLSSAAKYKDGTYTGQSADAFYGNIQVKAIIQNGKIVDVQFLDYPQDRGTSISINTQAMPILKSEAIQAQNATVDIVSGATDSSQAFMQSLQSALDQAKA